MTLPDRPSPLTAEPVHVHAGTSALVLDSPHSGTHYPADFDHACPRSALRVAEDTHVQALWGFAPALGATLIHAAFPRSYIDPNRALDEVDETLLAAAWPGPVTPSAKVRLGKGLAWRMLDDGTPIYARRLGVTELQARITQCWQPYHRALDEAVAAARVRRGFVILLNCHSMPAVAQAYATEHPYQAHADVVLGDRDGTTADPRLTRWIEQFLFSRGYTVSVNHPYKGVEIVRRHGRPAERQHAIQIELNKRLYMDENTLETHAGFAPLQAVLRELTEALLRFDAQAIEALPAGH
ncbi:MAG: N-formylglutamate amidohydrolase [Burkholderiales bacterium]|nr:N-formylglutamate amidohydrolase [Burkholderiales bacterium]